MKGYQSLYDMGILHQDLKLENILVHRVNDEYIFKIGDFGLCNPRAMELRYCGTK